LGCLGRARLDEGAREREAHGIEIIFVNLANAGSRPLKALIAGWFRFEEGHATAGDLLTCDLVREWLERAGYSCEVAVAEPFSGGISLRSAEAEKYSLAVFVCGPFSTWLLLTLMLKMLF
jgi:hypothetical protein